MRLLGGQRAWIVQRLSALYLLLCVVGGAAWLLLYGRPGFEGWRGFVAHPAGALALLLFYTALFAHAWVGLRDVVLDYVHPFGLRAGVLALVAGGLLALEGWTVLVLAGAHSVGN
ncbi:MAG TPA: succinate dehydrogenase, hydrophobic membrane anchor protein [Rhodocyclaceae bacterium]|nr:succinate dehydrogenase, hydrophobic membrane anchor protein [Rhodocyclaceae bacterium]